MEPRPERIAAAARALGGEVCERLALYADAIASALASDLGLVAWDREQLIGQAQIRQAQLRERRFPIHGGAPVRVIERRLQPLECLEVVWVHLRQGRKVHVCYESGVCGAVLELIAGIGRALGFGVLTLSDQPLSEGVETSFSDWEVAGVEPGLPRVALLEQSADPELAAYVLARTSLRRSGMDPHGVRQAWVVGPTARLERHLRRLWVGARLGPATDPGSFAGPVDEATRAAFWSSYEALSASADVEVLCSGGALERAGDPGPYVAPALFATAFPGPSVRPAGPMLVLLRCNSEQAWSAFDEAGRTGGQRLLLGDLPKGRSIKEGTLRHIRGALLVERLPPGLPDPRPA